jgi:tryptophan-rich sensory protein
MPISPESHLKPMFAAFNKSDTSALMLNILLATGAASVINGLIFGLGWDKSIDYAPKSPFEPPGYVIGLIWEGLFASMATARWLLNASGDPGAAQARAWITALIGFCLIWAFYSLAIGSIIGGLLGNLGTILLAGLTISQV